jgi:hypothetical protein
MVNCNVCEHARVEHEPCGYEDCLKLSCKRCGCHCDAVTCFTVVELKLRGRGVW